MSNKYLGPYEALPGAAQHCDKAIEFEAGASEEAQIIRHWYIIVRIIAWHCRQEWSIKKTVWHHHPKLWTMKLCHSIGEVRMSPLMVTGLQQTMSEEIGLKWYVFMAVSTSWYRADMIRQSMKMCLKGWQNDSNDRKWCHSRDSVVGKHNATMHWQQKLQKIGCLFWTP